jgi:hypothetical protein
MDVRITVQMTFDSGEKRIHQLDNISRPYSATCLDGFGLRLVDGKKSVGQIQKAIICDQIEEITQESRVCPTCSLVLAVHDYGTWVLDTLFGRLRVKVARLRRCSCDAKSSAFPGVSISPLASFFPYCATPELQRLLSELGSRQSFREAARLMQSFIPCPQPHHLTLRNLLGRISEKFE